MFQESKCSSARQTSSELVCSSCDKVLADHAYKVQRRKIRPLYEMLPGGKMKANPHDTVDSFHAGIIVGPKSDMYCQTCFDKLPTIEDLIRDYKRSLDSNSKNVD